MTTRRPLPLRLAAVLSVLVGATFVVLAGLSSGSGHGVFSWQISLLLAGYGLLLATAGWGLWRGWILARGPVVALAAINTFATGQLGATQPWAWVVTVLSLITLVCAALPSTSDALRGSD